MLLQRRLRPTLPPSPLSGPRMETGANPVLEESTGLTDLAFVAFVIEALTSLLGMINLYAIVAGITCHKLTLASRGKKPRDSNRVAGN